MPAPVVRNSSARSCTRTDQPRCANAQAAASPAKPAPTISTFRFFAMRLGIFPFRADCLCSSHQAAREFAMARLRHIAVCVKDLEKAAKFYETVFEMKEVGRETIEIGSAIYMSDGVINMALLNFAGAKGNDLADPKNAVGANHFGFQVEDIAETQKKIEAAGRKFFRDHGEE